MTMSSNMKLWELVEKTEEGKVKQYTTDDGAVLNSVDSINKIKKATEHFGIYGASWGLKDIKHSEQRINNGLMLGTVDAVFYVKDGEYKTEFQITNSIAISVVVEGKLSINSTYRKAIETDTISKALSRLGFNADIYSDDELVKTNVEINETQKGMDLISINKYGGGNE